MTSKEAIKDICYVIQFEDGSYWKGQRGKITKELRKVQVITRV